MKSKPYLPTNDPELVPWLKNFIIKILLYVVKYSLDPVLVQQTIDGINVYIKTGETIDLFDTFKQSLVERKNYYRNALPDKPALEALVAPALPVIDYAALPGILAKVRSLASTIKNNLKANDADMLDLGILGTDVAAPTHADTICTISLRNGQGGQPEIVWKKGVFESIEIQKKDATGSWAMLNISLHPNYTDATALPTNGQTAIWTYQAIYHFKGERIGQWSSEVSITVGK